jgi:hypothetical protein
MEITEMSMTSVSSIPLPVTQMPPAAPPPKPTSGDTDGPKDTDSSAPVKAATPSDVGQHLDITA